MLLEPLIMRYYSNYPRAQEELLRLGSIMRNNLVPRIEEFKQYDPNLRIRLALEHYNNAKETDGDLSGFTSIFYLTTLMPENLKEIEIDPKIKEEYPDGFPISKLTVDELMEMMCEPKLEKNDLNKGLWEKKVLHQVQLEHLREGVQPIVEEMAKAYGLADAMVEGVLKELKERSAE